jgi:hypothetical protein
MADVRTPTWDDLVQIQLWTPLSAIQVPAVELSERLRKIAAHQFILVVESDLRGTANGPFITMAVWAESDGAALRAIELSKESDQPCESDGPPERLLPPGATASYGSIVATLREQGADFMESAEYRIASDGAFVHKVIHSPQANFYFRSPEEIAGEKPYAVSYRLR